MNFKITNWLIVAVLCWDSAKFCSGQEEDEAIDEEDSNLINGTSYYDEPVLKWTTQLPFTGLTTIATPKVANGNAVTASPDDGGTSIYVTLNNGRLEVLSANDGSRRWGWAPTPILPGWVTACRTGVSFGRMKASTERFILHTVIHIPPMFDTSTQEEQDMKSQIIALHHPGKRVMWSAIIPGEIQGKPMVASGDQFGTVDREGGSYIVFTHNQNVTISTRGAPVGSFSMLLVETGELVFTEIAGDSRNDPNPTTDSMRLDSLRYPYGPLAHAPNPQGGQYPGGEGNAQDLFVWSTSIGNGIGDNGYTRLFQFPRFFQAENADMLATTFLKENRWNARASPAFTNDGLSLIFGVRENSIRGWTNNQAFDKGANIVESLDPDPDRTRIAIPYSPVLSPSESTFFVATSTGTLYCLTTANGTTVWNIDPESPISAKAMPSRDGTFLYFTTENGTVAAVTQDTGVEEWSISCADIVDESNSTACVDVHPIEAESSLSPNGLVLYYSDVFGNVKALTLGESGTPTPPPSEFPTFYPTTSRSPSLNPTVFASSVPSEHPSAMASSAPSLSTIPSISLTASPSNQPSSPEPSEQPSTSPSETPTMATEAPTVSSSPSKVPSSLPSSSPSQTTSSPSSDESAASRCSWSWMILLWTLVVSEWH